MLQNRIFDGFLFSGKCPFYKIRDFVDGFLQELAVRGIFDNNGSYEAYL